MAGHEYHALRMIAVCNRNADSCGRRDSRCDPADNLHLDTGRMQRLLLFAASAEYERVAALESRDAAPSMQMLEHLRDDAFLRRRRMTAAFADINNRRVGPRKLQHVGIHEIVDEYHVGLCEGARCLQRHQFDVAGPCADQPRAIAPR